MYPRLFTIGPFTVYSYGLMLAIAFLVANAVLVRELRRKGMDPRHGSSITLLAIIFGVIGSKILYLLENWSDFVRSPSDMALSPGGLTWYGGLILATVAILLYAKLKRLRFLAICDAAAPALMISYGIGRIGCHLSGDGDYGVPTSLPWAMEYSKGTYPPSLAFRNFPEIVTKYGVDGVVPDTIRVHPAPLYEFVLAVILFVVLWRLRARLQAPGSLFSLYLILSGAARFFVEFVRINPRLLFGLSEAQLVAIALILLGAVGMKYFARFASG